jgi:hypothetical protein
MSVQLAAERSKFAAVISWLLLITLGIFLLNYSIDGFRSLSRQTAVEKVSLKGSEGLRHKPLYKPALALPKALVKLSFVFSLSLLRFDFKQNLHTWPVLSNGLERAPPSV